MEYSICDQKRIFTEKGNSTLNNMVTLQFSLPSGSDCYMYRVRVTDGGSTVAVMGMVDSRTGKCSHKNLLSVLKARL